MVCLGNICRSPLAEGILKEQSEDLGLEWTVDSAGTSGFHIGELPDRRSIEVAKNHGIDLSEQRSRKFDSSDFSKFDLILTMDSSNYRDVIALANSENDKEKVDLLLNYAYPRENRNVPDPYYEGGFESVYEMISESCQKIIDAHR